MALEHARYLWILLIVPLFVYVSVRSYRESSRWLYAFARKKRNAAKDGWHIVFLCGAIAAVAVSQAGPKMLYERTRFDRSGIDIGIGIDVSKSMLAEDAALPPEARDLFRSPSRLNRARYCALRLLTELQGERVGVYLFANKGVEVVPFTTDYGYCRYIVQHINDTDMAISGSDLGEAIVHGVSMYEESNGRRVKRLILISDGEDISIDQSRLYEAAEQASHKGIHIYTIGIGMGTPVLIPIRNVDATSIVDYYLDEDGSYLRTNLVKETLDKIAHMSGGAYFHVDEQQVPRRLMESILSDAKSIEYTQGVELAWMDLSPLFLLSGIVFFVAGVFVNN